MYRYSDLYVYDTRELAEEAMMEYIRNHKKNIELAYDKYRVLLARELQVDQDRLGTLILSHDNSKINNQVEHYGYLMEHYPFKDDGIGMDKYGLRKSIYEKALLSHYHNNPHHPEYWIVFRDNVMVATPMESIYIAEMILDWIAHESDGRGSVKEYWFNNRSSKLINYDTIKIIDTIIDKLDDDDSDIPFIESPLTKNIMRRHKTKTVQEIAK